MIQRKMSHLFKKKKEEKGNLLWGEIFYFTRLKVYKNSDGFFFFFNKRSGGMWLISKLKRLAMCECVCIFSLKMFEEATKGIVSDLMAVDKHKCSCL